MPATHPLTKQQIALLDHYATCHNGTESALKAGYSKSSAPQMAKRTLKNPKGQEYLLHIQTKTRAITGYDLAAACADIRRAIDFAYEKGNAMAVVKGNELLLKANGLLVERHIHETIDLTAALQAAKARVINPMLLSRAHKLADKHSDNGTDYVEASAISTASDASMS